jgi:hypothetical protein
MQRSQIVRFALASGSVRVPGIAPQQQHNNNNNNNNNTIASLNSSTKAGNTHLFARQEYMKDKTYIPKYTTNMSKQPRNKLQQELLKPQLRE